MSFAMPDCNNPIIKKYEKQGFENLEKLRKFKKGGQMEKLKEAINNEIKFLKEDNTKLNQENLELLENKKILNKMLSQIPTKVLIEELKGRTGIESADLNKKDIFVSALDEIYKIENSDVLLVIKY